MVETLYRDATLFVTKDALPEKKPAAVSKRKDQRVGGLLVSDCPATALLDVEDWESPCNLRPSSQRECVPSQ